MEIQLLCVGKTDRTFWSTAVAEYQKRLQHYIKFSISYLPDVKASKKANALKIKTEEAKFILQKGPTHPQFLVTWSLLLL